MDNGFFMVFVEGENTPMEQYPDFEKAEKEAKRLSDKYRKKAFVLESTSLVIPDIKIDSFKDALKYLRCKDNVYMCGKALNALNKLFTIAEAWNNADNFIPNFLDFHQGKYSPRFKYKEEVKGFICVGDNYSLTESWFGSRLCFSTSERAEQFGKQFIDLWNDFLLFR